MEPNPTTISDLIQQYQDRTGATYRDIAKLTGISVAKVGQLARDSTALNVRALTQKKLSTGLRIPLATVRRAVAASMNYPTGDIIRSGPIQEMIDQLEEFTDSEVTMVAEIVAAIARNRVMPEPDTEVEIASEPEPDAELEPSE